MCGIAGVFGPPSPLAVVTRMSQCLAHRGRDDEGTVELSNTDGAIVGALGHRRLSVLDLTSAGRQPMRSGRAGVSIVFNGEIYNFRQLRGRLADRGFRFQSDSDTEVLVAGWESDGVEFLRSLRGMFAFALWDPAAGELVLARDQFGIKPLYVARRGDGIAFASEVRALLSAGFGDRSLSVDAVSAYLALGSIPEPLSIVRGVDPLPAGAVRRLRIRGGKVVSDRTEIFAQALEPTDEPLITRAAPAAALVREALRESVGYHLVSDVPVGLFLSGGVDSSALVALAAEAAGTRLDTFTVVFAEARFSEAGPARAVATQYGTRHQEIPLGAPDFLNALPDAFGAMDQPSLDGLNTYVVSRAVHGAGLKVVLSGLGGDEFFGGYASFRRGWAARGWWRPTAALHPMAARIARTIGDGRADKAAAFLGEQDLALGAYRASRALFAERGLAALVGRDAEIPVDPAPARLSLLQRISWYEATGYMRSVLLRDSDVFSMAHHLELRVPFVDRGVVAASLRIDDALKMEGGPKGILVQAVRDLLPRDVWDRPKQGFTLPFADWMRGPLAQDVGEALTSGARLERVGLRPQAVLNVWRAFERGEGGVSWSRPWALYTLVHWAETVGASMSSDFGGAAERQVA